MFYSEACWKGKVAVVANNLRRMGSDSAKFYALQENIKMRVLGMGWTQFAITWSEKQGNKRRKKSVKVLADHLRYIIKAERKLEAKPEPDINLPERPDMPVFGTVTRQRAKGSAKDSVNEEKFRRDTERLRRKREAEGEESLYAELQPF